MTPANPKAITIDIGTGAASTRSTLQVMASLAVDYSKNPGIRQFAASLVAGLQSRDYYAEAETLSNYMRDHIRFVRDPATAELLQMPDYTLAVGYGDCDDKVTTLAALMLSIGIPVRFVAVGPDSNTYIHVFLQANINGTWVTAETAAPLPVAFGRIASQAAALPASMTYDVSTHTIVTMGALPAHTYIRGPNPYTFTGTPVTISKLIQYPQSYPSFTAQEAVAFLSNVGANVLGEALVSSMISVTPGEFLSVLMEGGGPWEGFNTDPPYPYPDEYFATIPQYCNAYGLPTTVPPGQQTYSGGGSSSHGHPVYQLNGLAGVGDMIPWTNPCTGQVEQVIDMGGGAIIRPGNTNGNPVDFTSWLYYGIINGTVKASSAWAHSASLSNWYNENVAGPHGMLNRYAPSIIEAAVLAFFTAGFGGELFGSTAAGGSGATTATTGLSADEISQINATVAAEGNAAQLTAIDLSTFSVPVSIDLATIGEQVGMAAGTGSTLLQGAGTAAAKLGLTAATTAAGIETQKLLAPSNDAMLPPMSQPANTPNPNAAKTVLLLAAAGLGLFALVHT